MASSVFFYHSDHLGSTSYVTDGDGNATQFVAYTPFGEPLVDEHAVSYESPYKFNGKEMDAETGLYNYGARYYDPSLALWYGVDALAEKYPSLGGYVYCANNPVRLIDPDGNLPIETIWDVANVALGVGSFIDNVKSGNYCAALLDLGGVVVDAAASAVPYVPGGAGTAIKASRAAKVADKVKDAEKTVGSVVAPKQRKAPAANQGRTNTPHGGKVHDESINDAVTNLPKDVEDVRKNQVQVDVNGNVVGNNRPDLQYNKDGVHHNVEFDTNRSQMEHHRHVVSKNDPNAVNEFHYLGQ